MGPAILSIKCEGWGNSFDCEIKAGTTMVSDISGPAAALVPVKKCSASCWPGQNCPQPCIGIATPYLVLSSETTSNLVFIWKVP